MQGNKGIAKILIIIVSVLFLTSITILFLVLNQEDEQEMLAVSDATRIISIDERSAGVSAENIIITNSSESFVRGKLFDSFAGVEKDFYLIKIGDTWRVVDITDQPVSCERFARLGFPNVFIQDCKLSFSDAVTLSEIDKTLEDFFLSSENTNLRIIGVVDSIVENENGQIITLISGDQTIQIQINSEDETVQEGDLIVTSITPPNINNPNNSTQTTYNTTGTVAVNSDDRELFENIPTTPTSQTPTSNTEDPSKKLDKINAPKSYAPPSYFKNVYDQDNSFIDVELEGSF